MTVDDDSLVPRLRSLFYFPSDNKLQTENVRSGIDENRMLFREFQHRKQVSRYRRSDRNESKNQDEVPSFHKTKIHRQDQTQLLL